MSGGGLGQLCNLVHFDSKHDEVVLKGGQNEILNTTSRAEFVYTVAKTEEKLRTLSESVKVVVALPATPTMGAEEDGKAKYLVDKIPAIDSITAVKFDHIEYEGNHPTEKGTAEIINQIQNAVNDVIIQEEADGNYTTPRKYSLVGSTYKVGCRGCDFPQFTPSLCDPCAEAAAQCKTDELDAIINAIDVEMYPEIALNTPNPSVEEAEGHETFQRCGCRQDGW